MLSRGMRDKQFKFRRDPQVVYVQPYPPPPLRWGRGDVTATRRVKLHYQSFFINATSKLVTKLQAIRARDLLIQQFCMRFFGFDPIFFRFFCFGYFFLRFCGFQWAPMPPSISNINVHKEQIYLSSALRKTFTFRCLGVSLLSFLYDYTASAFADSYSYNDSSV